MTKFIRTGILSLGGVLLLVAGSADAQPTKESLACSSAKLKAYSKYAGGQIKCYSKAVSKALAVDPLCLSKNATKLTDSFNKAVLKGGCPTEGEPEGNLANSFIRLDAYVNTVQTNLSVGVVPPGNKCQSKKLGAVSKLAASLFNCESKAAKKNEPVDQVKCVDKAQTKAQQAFTKEETKVGNDCTTTNDYITEGGNATDVVRIQTFFTPRFDGCGNRIVTAPENCDDGNTSDADFCPSDCNVESCVPTATLQQVTLVTTDPDIAATDIFLDYPEGKLSLEGSGGAVTPGRVVPFAGSFDVFDFDHAFNYVGFDLFNFGTTSIATIDFNTCTGALPATAGEFACTVNSATDDTGLDVEGVTCSVTVP